MERKEFLKSIGGGAALALTLGCFGGCLREELDPEETATDGTSTDTSSTDTSQTSSGSSSGTSSNVLFTVDLQASEASNLSSNGGYIIKNNVVVARNSNGDYVAATVVCSHEYKKKVIFRNNEYYCTEHGARFSQTGEGLNRDASRGLKIYQTELNGNVLSILA